MIVQQRKTLKRKHILPICLLTLAAIFVAVAVWIIVMG